MSQPNPLDGMPPLRRSLPGFAHARVTNPMLQFGAGAPVQVASSSVAVDAPPIQANPRTYSRGRTKIRITRATRGPVCGPHQEWDPRTKECVPKKQRNANPVSVGECFPKFDPIQMYGVGQPQQMMQPNPMQPNPMQPNPMQPNPMQPNPLQPLPAGPGIDPGTGMPRLRGSRNLR